MAITTTTSQFELFPGNTPNTPYAQEGRPYALKVLALTFDKLLIATVGFIMVMVFAFSLGVEKGKRLSANSASVFKGTIVRQPQSSKPLPAVVNTSYQKQPSVRQTKPLREVKPSISLDDSVTITSALPVLPPKVQQIKLPENVYTVQVASYKREKKAQEAATNLKRDGYDIFVLPKGDYAILCVGKFVEKNQATQYASKLKRKFKDCVIRRL